MGMKPRDPNENNRNPRQDPDKIKPFQDPDLTPDETNPINPKTDEPDIHEHKK